MGKMSQSPKLPVLQPTNDEGGGCGRREVLGGIAIASLLPMACRIDDPGIDPAGVDAAPGGDAAMGSGFEMCGANLCVDLTHPNNANLLTVGGFRVIQNGTKKIMVARTTATEFATMSAVCTHAGCTVAFKPAASQMQCPCHGSKYALDGMIVQMAPGSVNLADLKLFSITFDEPGNLLTIMLT
jgi:nitrite reductase/ring-hydroxylating ferredoxin subunit